MFVNPSELRTMKRKRKMVVFKIFSQKNGKFLEICRVIYFRIKNNPILKSWAAYALRG